MATYNLIVSILLVLVCSVQTYNILGMFPHSGKSHMVVFSSLLEELARRGHNVTVVSVFPSIHPLPNYEDVDLSKYIPKLYGVVNMSCLDSDSRISRYMEARTIFRLADLSCAAISSKTFQDFLSSQKKFDAILFEDFNSICYFGISELFKVPIISMSSGSILPWTYSRYGIPENPAVVPNVMLPLTDKMTFLERVENTVITFLHKLVFKYYRSEKDKAMVRNFIGTEATELERYASNSSLLLINTHYSLTLSRSLAPNVIEIGGIHITQPKPLPLHLKTFIDDSPGGVIYFSMGSMTQGDSIHAEKRDALIRAFDSLPHRVLWKYENESIEHSTDKILLQEWLPQLDVLCHPNVKLFISHGGLLGIMEAVYCGVPIVVIPQFGDQFSNAAALEANEGGVVLKTGDITEESACKAIRSALKLRDKAKALSNRFRDRPMTPLETAVYWTEYVIKHNGAPFMRTAAADMPFYQFYLLDVFTFILIIVAMLLYVGSWLLKMLLRKLFSSKSSKPKTE